MILSELYFRIIHHDKLSLDNVLKMNEPRHIIIEVHLLLH